MAVKNVSQKLTLSGIAILTVMILMTISLGSCNISYLTQAIAGHLRIMSARQSIEKMLKKDHLDNETENKLKLVLEIHQFAIKELGLPENKSYTVYAEIKDEYPGWNVFCAPKFSIEPKTWCFPVAGCVVYHGYFKKEKALKFAKKMEQEGFDVYVSAFTAYSTLGWYKDPILSTHLRYDSIRLAGLIIHELAHQRFYLKGNSQVSESFAVTVERAGVMRWLESLGRTDQLVIAKKDWEKEDQYILKLLEAKDQLNGIYLSHQDSLSMLRQKDSVLQALNEEIYSGKAKLNNAWFVPISTYHSLVPEFQRKLDSLGGDFRRFYELMKSQ